MLKAVATMHGRNIESGSYSGTGLQTRGPEGEGYSYDNRLCPHCVHLSCGVIGQSCGELQ
jgi:hypothetical protein